MEGPEGGTVIFVELQELNPTHVRSMDQILLLLMLLHLRQGPCLSEGEAKRIAFRAAGDSSIHYCLLGLTVTSAA